MDCLKDDIIDSFRIYQMPSVSGLYDYDSSVELYYRLVQELFSYGFLVMDHDGTKVTYVFLQFQ